MKFGTQNRNSRAGFTLAEVLAAMLFLAIVFPTVVEALHIASLSGEVAVRKNMAARIADRILNESVITTNWTGNVLNGTASEGALNFEWSLSIQDWPSQNEQELPSSSLSVPSGGAQAMTVQAMPQNIMQKLTANVTFQAQGKVYSVALSTLVNSVNRPGGNVGMR
jgi:Tfp pilus assembly protein PilV